MRKIRFILLAFLAHHVSHASEFRVAILGDSITHGGNWPTKVESALRSTPTFADAAFVNFGLGGESVAELSKPGLAGPLCLHERLTRILDVFKPTHVLACYGMNDGMYLLPLDETRQKAFHDGMTRLKTEVENRGAKLVAITAPLYDGDNPNPEPQGYDTVLDAQATWLLSQKDWQVIDIRPALRNAVAAAKKTDPQFVYAADKVHPGPQGHDFIAASVIRQIWPIWQLPGQPVVADGKALEILGQRRWMLQYPWLKKTGHKLSGVPDGLPLEEAEAQAAKLLLDYRAAIPALQSRAAPADGKFHLAVDGKSNCVIVVNAVHKPADGGMNGNVWFAATEFQKYVKCMSGAELVIVALADNATAELEALQGKPVIAIGASAFTRRLGISTEGMVEDGFLIRVTPEHLSIVGHDASTWWNEQKVVPIASGTLHGVYHLLRELGVRTFFEDESLDVIPDLKTVSLDAREITDAPFFPFRCGSGRAWGYKAGYGGNLDPWPTRHSFANEWQKITLDGKETTMDWWARYRESHPEYFALDPKGNRMSMLRFTEAGVQQQIVRDASAWFDKGEDYYSLLQNDGYTDIDQSPETQRLIDPSRGLQGLLSEAVMRPFIGIASKLNESHPGKTVALGAYSCYAYPPKDMKTLPPNAAVMLALQRLNNIVPRGMAVNRQLLDEWIKLNPKELYLWEYYCFDSWRWRVPHYELFPRFLPHTIAEDIRHLAAVRERHPNFRGQWMFGERRADDANAWWHLPNMYVTGRLFWNPKLDIDVLLEDFHSKAFGAAAGEMRAFYTLCEKTASEGMAGLYARKPPVITYQGGSLNEAASMGYDYIDGHFTQDDFLSVWNPRVIGELRPLIDEASRKAKGTPSEARVEWVRKHFKSLEDIVVKNSPPGLPAAASDWNGYTKHSFDFEGHHAFVVVPKEAAAGKPWVWRTSFPDFHAEVDIELVKGGFHIAHVDVVAMLGSDESLAIMDRFYDHVRKQWGLAEKPALEAVSRGGLHAYRYAATRTDRIACIYADTPVMDLKSWPLLHPKGSLADALKFYGFADEAALIAYDQDPIDLLEPIARAKLPLRHVISPNDLVVPAENNTLEAKRRLEALGWQMDVLVVDAATTLNEGHHFPLVGIEESVAFIRKHAGAGK